jgi:glycosyltransferase involved in cell wall biosynthesis
MDLLVANVDLRIQLGENAYERAITLFSSDAITAEWLTFYKKLLHQ